MHDHEPELMADAERRAAAYLAGTPTRRVFPGAAAVAALAAFDEPLPGPGRPAAETLALLDDTGSPATVASNGPHYYGFVIGAALPAAAAAERLALAWDQCASSPTNSPAAAAIEATAARWLLDILDLPRGAAIGFGTSASACGLACLAAARRALLGRAGWDFDADGLIGAPEVTVIVPETVHVTILKALRILGFGTARLLRAPVDAHGAVDPQRLPPLDDRTILCLQAGEVNGGGFDPFAALIPRARAAGAWTHVDGAFGLWARASASHRHLTDGVEGADSWTTDGHKWLNTPYDGAMAICRDPAALEGAMASDAAYLTASEGAQRNRTLEFSRRARGIAVWAALRTLGRDGVAAMIDHHCALARRVAVGLAALGLEVPAPVVLNQVLARGRDPAHTAAIRAAVERSGDAWFGATIWRGVPALRISLSSWRTGETDADRLIETIRAALAAVASNDV